jgi:hypothetical protein
VEDRKQALAHCSTMAESPVRRGVTTPCSAFQRTLTSFATSRLPLSVLYDRPVRELLVEAVAAMPLTFRRNDVVDWFRVHYPAVKPGTVTAHITAATVNSRSRHHYPGADQYLLFQRDDHLLERYEPLRHGYWDAWGEPIPAPATSGAPTDVARTDPRPIPPAQEFEERARVACSLHWGLDLRSAVVDVAPGVTHQFDIVSSDRRIVGDAKWFKNLPVPAAKWSVIAEYVWLLQHLTDAEVRFIVFGQDTEVPERWLRRFRPLTAGIDFYFLAEHSTDLLPL